MENGPDFWVDYYSGTTDRDVAVVLGALRGPLSGKLWDCQNGRPTRAKNYERAVVFTPPGGGNPVCLEYGGNASQGRVFFHGAGAAGRVLCELLRARGLPHQVTRLDVCGDWEWDGAFDWVIGRLDGVQAAHGLYTRDEGDWSPHQGVGRSRYYGSVPLKALSPRLLLLCYEKGKQLGLPAGEGGERVRVEARFRPANRREKERAALLEPREVFVLAAWLRAVFRALGGAPGGSLPPLEPRKVSPLESSLYHLRGQYGGVCERASAEIGAGELTRFLLGACDLTTDGGRLRVGERVAPPARPGGRVLAWGFGAENPTTGEIEESEFVLEDHRVFERGVASKGEDGAPAGGLLVGDDTADESGSGAG